MRFALLEIPARYGEPDDVFNQARALLLDPETVGPETSSEARPDLVLFPELATTGYVSPRGDFDLRRFAEPREGPMLARARRLAHDVHATVVVPLVERAIGERGDRFYNAMSVVTPTGEVIVHYQKRHPWVPETWATPGANATPVFEIAGVTCALGICYDIHFLSRESADALDRADLLLFPSAWVDLGATEARSFESPGEPRELRAPILEGLAEDFDVVIANANWGPGSPRIEGQGSSRIVGPRGEIARVQSIHGTAQRLDGEVFARPKRG